MISGAGPAGALASIHLSRLGIAHILIDADVFPRDKICGDALSGKVFNELKRAGIGYPEQLLLNKDLSPCYGIRFVSPEGKQLDLPFKWNDQGLSHTPGAVCKRIDFDYFLFKHAMASSHCTYIHAKLNEVEISKEMGQATIDTINGEKNIHFKLILAADGDRSLTAKKYGHKTVKPTKYSAGIRQYHSGVKDLHPQNYIELIFLKELLPGYLWIFPLGNGQANVGAGMLKKDISSRKINLKTWMHQAMYEHPALKERFADSVALEKPHGWGLPLGVGKQKISGNRFMLLGDAASLIDPFTGEGIANAMISGRVAAEMASDALTKQKFDAHFMTSYDKLLFAKIGSELRISYWLQRLIRFPKLMDFVIRKAMKNESMRQTMTMMFDDVQMREQLKRPSFYLKLLFNK